MVSFMTPKVPSSLSHISTSWKVTWPLSFRVFCHFSIVDFVLVFFQFVMGLKWSVWTNKTIVWVDIVFLNHMSIINYSSFQNQIANSAFHIANVTEPTYWWHWDFWWFLFIKLTNTMKLIIVCLKFCFISEALSIGFKTFHTLNLQNHVCKFSRTPAW